LTKTKRDYDSNYYNFTFVNTAGTGKIHLLIPMVGTTKVTWNFFISYVETPNKKIVFEQSLYASTVGWNIPENEVSAPTLTISNSIVYNQGGTKKRLSLVKSNNVLINPDAKIQLCNISTERIIFDKSSNVNATSEFVLMHNSAFVNTWHRKVISIDF